MRTGSPNINTLWADIFVEELARCGVREAVLSPGSRSTPLVLALARHPDIRAHTVLDERAAGFFALGLARESHRPSVLLCTSGTAAANFLPVVCEADASRLPLLVLTADRPAHLRDSEAPQSMDQIRLYGGRVRWFCDVPQPEADEMKLRALRSAACHAVARAGLLDPGPVHLNFPFRKPLEPSVSVAGHAAVDAGVFSSRSLGVQGRMDGRAFTRYSTGEDFDALVDRMEDAIRAHSRVLIAAGPDPDGVIAPEDVFRFADAAGIPVFAEALSRLRFHAGRSPLVLAAADLLLRSPAFCERATPGMIIRVGRYATGRPTQEFLAALSNHVQILVTPALSRSDPDFVLTEHVVCRPGLLFAALAERFRRRPRRLCDTDWFETLREADAHVREACARELSSIEEPFEGWVYGDIGAALTDGAAVVVSSSMPVRDLDTFLHHAPADTEFHCNRGVNGIDGVTATAYGIATGRQGRTVLITGDIAFLHDLNSLHIAGRSDVDLTVVVVHNDGGQIFDHLPIRDHDPEFTRHFLTPHGIRFGAAAELFGVSHAAADTRQEFQTVFAAAMREPGTRIIELRVDMARSRALRTSLLDRLQAGVGDFLGSKRAAERSRSSATPLPLAWMRLYRGLTSSVPAILLHGFTRNASSWIEIVEHFDGRDVVAFDLMGHGDSPVPDAAVHAEAYSLPAMTDALAEGLDRIGAAKAHLAGYSLGGRTALHFALSHPERLASLTLISASPGILDEAERAARRETDARLVKSIERNGLHAFIGEWMHNPLIRGGAGPGTPAERKRREERLRQQARGLAGSLLGSGQGIQIPLWDQLRFLRIPVLLIAGQRDEKYLGILAAMRERIQDARALVIDGAGHDVPSEAPGLLARAMTNFWNSCESTHTH